MASLYQISEEFLHLEQLYEEAINEETGEIENVEKLEEIEASLQRMLVNKSENIIKYIRSEEATIKAFKEEEDRLKKCRQAKEKKLESFSRYIKDNMTKMGSKPIETNLGKISLRKSVKTIVNEDLIEFNEKYAVKQEVIKYDKTTIKKLLSEGTEIKGAYLEENFSVNIK